MGEEVILIEHASGDNLVIPYSIATEESRLKILEMLRQRFEMVGQRQASGRISFQIHTPGWKRFKLERNSVRYVMIPSGKWITFDFDKNQVLMKGCWE